LLRPRPVDERRDDGTLVTEALIMAIWRGDKPNALLHYSDRGSQYTSDQFP
jgi:transposase InsO family protein